MTDGLAVAYIGNHAPPYGTEQQIGYALERVGCDVIRVQEDIAHRRGAAALADEWRREGVRLCVYTRTHNQSALAYGWTAPDPWAPIRDAGIVSATVHLDVFVGLAREHFLAERDPMFTVDHCFTADGSPECAAAMREHGYRHHWLPPAVDERVLFRVELPYVVPIDAPPIVFVGSRHGYHNEHPWRQILLDTLEARYGDQFRWYGNGSPYGTLRGPDLDALYASDRVLIGDSCFAGARDRYWSDRVPEALGRGGLLLHEWLPPDWYQHGIEYVAYVPVPDALVAQVDAVWAMGPEARAQIKRQGRRLVAGRDTWTYRMRELLRVCGLAEREDHDV